MTAKRWWIVGGAGVAAFGATVAVLTLRDGMRVASAQLDAVYAESRRLGLPLEESDMLPNPPVPDGDNASPLIDESIALLKEANQVRPRVSDMDAMARKGQFGELHAALARFRKPIEMALAASARPKYWKPRDFGLGPSLLFPDFAEVKNLVKLLVADAADSARRRELKIALARLDAARRIGSFLGSEPTLIGMLVSIACDAISTRGYEALLTTFGQDVQALLEIGHSLEAAPTSPNFANALKGEVFLSLSLFRNWRAFGGLRLLSGDANAALPEFDPKRLKRSGLPDETEPRAFLMRSLEFWNRVWQWPEFRASPVMLGKRLDDEALKIDKQADPSYRALRLLLPVFAQAGQACLKLECDRAAMRGLAKALEFRAAHRRWPHNAQELAGPIDPADGQPVRVRSGADGIRVYSVGPDGEDDGGTTQYEAKRRKPDASKFDIVAFYPASLRPR